MTPTLLRNVLKAARHPSIKVTLLDDRMRYVCSVNYKGRWVPSEYGIANAEEIRFKEMSRGKMISYIKIGNNPPVPIANGATVGLGDQPLFAPGALERSL
jgi:hypothetical protein